MFLKIATVLVFGVIGVLVISASLSHEPERPRQAQPPTAPVSAPAPQPVWADEFNGTQVDQSKWSVYDGPGDGGNGIRTPTHATVANGVLTLTCTTDERCAGMMGNYAQKSGTWATRIKMSPADTNVHPVLLLWPTDGVFPGHGEVDYQESSDPARQATDGFLHFGYNNDQTFGKVNVDLTQWHVFSVTWTPTSMTYYVDGQQWFQDTDPAHMPPVPMNPTIQLDAQGPIKKGGTLSVDWMRIYKR
jgi:beta-glucanase (GH16 family)